MFPSIEYTPHSLINSVLYWSTILNIFREICNNLAPYYFPYIKGEGNKFAYLCYEFAGNDCPHALNSHDFEDIGLLTNTVAKVGANMFEAIKSNVQPAWFLYCTQKRKFLDYANSTFYRFV